MKQPLLAVAAHIRHRETNYDELLSQGYYRGEARARIVFSTTLALLSRPTSPRVVRLNDAGRRGANSLT